MTVLTIDRNKFRVQFRHLSKLTKRPTLFKAPMNVLTTCVITMETMEDSKWEFRGVALGHAMCDPGDNFRKDFARDTSFRRAVNDCALLRDVREALVAEYDRIKPQTTTTPAAKYSSRAKAAIADFLRTIASDVNATPEEAEKIRAAAEVIKNAGVAPKVGLSTVERENLKSAGTSVRERRATVEGRAAVNAEKRLRRQNAMKAVVLEIPQAAG